MRELSRDRRSGEDRSAVAVRANSLVTVTSSTHKVKGFILQLITFI
jgi:hypothetical protein